MGDQKTSNSYVSPRYSADNHFHVWFLPAIGTMLFVSVWFLLWLIDQHGNRLWGLTDFVAGVGRLPRHWLTGEIGLHLYVLTACIVNALILVMIGLCQDVLQVSKRILWLYAAIPLGSFACVALMEAKPPAYECLILLLLMHFFLGIVVVAFLSCVLYPLWSIPRTFRENDRCILKHWAAFLSSYGIALLAAVALGTHSYGREGEHLGLMFVVIPLLGMLAGVFLIQAVVLASARVRGAAPLLMVGFPCWAIGIPIVVRVVTRLYYGFTLN